MNWNFKREKNLYPIVSEGKHRCRIIEAEMAESKRGNDMLVLTLEFDGNEPTLRHYIVFMTDHPEITNRQLTSFFDSFGIDDGNFDILDYIGKVGACMIRHKEDETYGTQARVSYFIAKDKQDDLPPWSKTELPYGKMQDIEDENLPF
jgi:hypothetical protein